MKPSIFQQLLSGRAISWVKLHDSHDESLVFFRDFLCCHTMKRLQCLWWTLLHDHRDEADFHIVGDLLIGQREGSEYPMMLKQNLGVVIVVIGWQMRIKDIEPTAIDQTDKLEHRTVSHISLDLIDQNLQLLQMTKYQVKWTKVALGRLLG